MAAPPILEKPEVKVSFAEFGSYGPSATYGIQRDLISRYTPPPPAQQGISPPQQEAAPWFREIGATTSDPILEKRIWSPDFAQHYQTRRWGETYSGRTWLRLWGRFIVGTAFYAAAQLYANKALGDYNNVNAPKNPLQHVARFIDNTAGKAIKSVSRNEKSVIFHDTRSFGYQNAAGEAIKGRSLGHEATSVTFDFAAMSFGDYVTRYAVGLFDRNSRTKWRDKDGRLNLAGGLKEVGETLFKAVTYAAGEDMFVALPYVYYMRLSRSVINKFSPGFKYDSDNVTFGGSFKTKDGKVTGDYNLEGMVDITGRFSVYNVGTKMFRDLYAVIERKLNELLHDNHQAKANKDREPLTVSRAITKSVKYTAVTTTKMMFLMIPSAFLFAALRTPQYKKNGLLIDPEKGVAGNLAERGAIGAGLPTPANKAGAFTNAMYADPKDAPWYSKITNPTGQATYKLGGFYDGLLQKVPGVPGIKQDFAYRWADAAVSYTPYFIVKSDWSTAFYDTNRTNFVLGGFYSALWKAAKATASFDGKKINPAGRELKKWWNEVLLAMLKQPSPNYEIEIQQAMNDEGYKASSEAFDIYQGEKHYRIGNHKNEGHSEKKSAAPSKRQPSHIDRELARREIEGNPQPGTISR